MGSTEAASAPAELAARLLDPRNWLGVGAATLEQPFETVLGLPRLADVPDIDRKLLHLMQCWVGVAQRSGTETGAYLVLGSSTARGATIDLAAPPAGRVVALPKAAGPFFGGPPVLGLGDVDGDGLDDVGTATRRRGAQGGVVVLGRRAWPARVNLDRLGRRGITILTGQGSPATPWPVVSSSMVWPP